MKRPTNCEVCGSNAAKYKCPACTTAYCSVPCFKRHKESPCSKPIEQPKDNRNQEPPTTDHANLIKVAEEEGTTVTREQFERLANTPQIHELLKSRDLRTLVTSIDSAPDPENLLDAVRAQTNKDANAVQFRDLVDQILKAVDVENSVSINI